MGEGCVAMQVCLVPARVTRDVGTMIVDKGASNTCKQTQLNKCVYSEICKSPNPLPNPTVQTPLGPHNKKRISFFQVGQNPG
jgi:hypothetical protein